MAISNTISSYPSSNRFNRFECALNYEIDWIADPCEPIDSIRSSRFSIDNAWLRDILWMTRLRAMRLRLSNVDYEISNDRVDRFDE